MISFETLFQMSVQAWAEAPGRVNLMGEHTDYNQGFVLPTILPQQTRVELAIDPDHTEHIDAFSTNYSEQWQRPISAPTSRHWTDYLLACLQQLQNQQIAIPGLKVFVQSTVPIGAGVSSSAALEVAFLKALRVLLNLNLTDLEIALMAQQAESEGVGMPCGVMDQMVSALGRSQFAFFLDTQALSFEQIPLPITHRFAVVHSGKTHQLATSGYKTRRQECEAAAVWLKIGSLREASESDLEQSSDLPETLRKRAMHVITENQRVLQSVAALKDNRITDLGQLMKSSHLSQKHHFEVTIPETDTLWEVALRQGAIGARQTGGGFGGAIVALVANESVQTWWNAVSQACPQASLIAL